ncbi:MAG: ABC transporter permease [Acidobacteriota bacterium]|nr:MAG: ABC transporter permease [Acidobacteriota bacterium]
MLWNYLKMAVKVLRRRKFFTLVSLFAIASTLVTLMVAVSFLDHVLGTRAPEVNGDRTLILSRVEFVGPKSLYRTGPGFALLDRFLRELPGVETLSIASESPARVVSYMGGTKVKLQMRRTDAEFWKVFHFDFVDGGPYSREDDLEGKAVAVVSRSTAEKVFGETAAVGQTLRIDGQTFQVIGVVSDVPAYRYVPFGDFWVPIGSAKTDNYRRKLAGGFMGLFLTEPGADVSQIRSAFRDRLDAVASDEPAWELVQATLDNRIDSLTQQFGLSSTVFLGLVALLMVLFMVLPAVNLVNLNLSRILERCAEIGVRKAFGADSFNLSIQFVIENLVVTFLGGGIAMLGSVLILEVIEQSGFIPYATFEMNMRIFFVSLVITLFFGILSAAYPAWRMSRLNPADALRGGQR